MVGRVGLSVRRACTLLGAARSGLGYQSGKVAADAPVIDRMQALAARIGGSAIAYLHLSGREG